MPHHVYCIRIWAQKPTDLSSPGHLGELLTGLVMDKWELDDLSEQICHRFVTTSRPVSYVATVTHMVLPPEPAMWRYNGFYCPYSRY